MKKGKINLRKFVNNVIVQGGVVFRIAIAGNDFCVFDERKYFNCVKRNLISELYHNGTVWQPKWEKKKPD